MPKIIARVKEQLLDEVRREIETQGYAGTTIRSVAEGCSISVGTVYNYFKSKDELVATAVAEDWAKTTEDLRSLSPSSAREMVSELWEALKTFEEEHRAIFTDCEAEKKFSSVFAKWHTVLRSQVAAFLSPYFEGDYLPLFVSEALLSWVTEGTKKEDFLDVIDKLISKETKQ